MRTWTEDDRRKHSELMRQRIHEWQPWQVAGDRSNARYNAVRHARHSVPGLEQRKLRKELRIVVRQLAGQIEENLQCWKAAEFDRISSPMGAVKRLDKISKRLQRVNCEVVSLREYREKRKQKTRNH